MMTADPAKFSPKRYARIGGVLYLYIILAGIFVELFVRGKLVVSGDAAATAANILAHETRWRVAFSAGCPTQASFACVGLLTFPGGSTAISRHPNLHATG